MVITRVLLTKARPRQKRMATKTERAEWWCSFLSCALEETWYRRFVAATEHDTSVFTTARLWGRENRLSREEQGRNLSFVARTGTTNVKRVKWPSSFKNGSALLNFPSVYARGTSTYARESHEFPPREPTGLVPTGPKVLNGRQRSWSWVPWRARVWR